MCNLCEKVKKSTNYNSFMEKMLSADVERIEFSKTMAEEMPSLSNLLYTSVNYPIELVYPMFEARTAFSVPSNYYQQLTVGEERHSNAFAHGAMRSLFFIGTRLFLFSKTVNHKDGKEFFTSFALLHFDKGEFRYSWEGDNLTISFDGDKTMKNLITEKTEKKHILFNFFSQNVKNHIVSREDVATSSQFKAIYAKHGTATSRVASIDIEGYAITVHHFSPHPYLLQISQELGYGSNREFQERGVLAYFKEHLSQNSTL